MINCLAEQFTHQTTIKQTLLGIVVALPEELSTLTKNALQQGHCLAISEHILVVYSGAGRENAQHAAKTLIANNVELLISWGCAAALTEQYKPGDLVLADRVLSEDGQYFYSSKPYLQTLLTVLQDKLSISTGTLLESSKIIASSHDKQNLHLTSSAVALDMESAAVFKVAQESGLACMAIRAIADPVSMDLPEVVVRSLNAQGRVELTKLLSLLLLKPQQIPALINLGWYFRAAQKTLKVVANQLKSLTDLSIPLS